MTMETLRCVNNIGNKYFIVKNGEIWQGKCVGVTFSVKLGAIGVKPVFQICRGELIETIENVYENLNDAQAMTNPLQPIEENFMGLYNRLCPTLPIYPSKGFDKFLTWEIIGKEPQERSASLYIQRFGKRYSYESIHYVRVIYKDNTPEYWFAYHDYKKGYEGVEFKYKVEDLKKCYRTREDALRSKPMEVHYLDED